MWTDDGFVVRFPETDEPPDPALLFPSRTRSKALVRASARRHGAVRGQVPRGRGAGAAPAAAPARRARAALAAAQAGVGSAGGGRALRLVPDDARDVPRVPARRLRPAGADRDPAPTSQRARSGWSRSIRRRRRRSRPRCSSATSPTTSTTATPRWPSAGRRRWPSTRPSSASCWAKPSCASCWTPTRSPRSSGSCSSSTSAIAPSARTACTICCCASAISAPTRSRCAVDARSRLRHSTQLAARRGAHRRAHRR